MTPAPSIESVVLLDEQGHAVGSMDKRDAHHQNTPLHLAFSCYLFDRSGAVLVTRRALDKRTFPGVWTNSCCGHPAPGEVIEDGVRRRVRQELGVRIHDLRLLLPTFRYRAVMPDGPMEHEMCPVFVATTYDAARPDPAEVEAVRWEQWPAFRASVLEGGREISSWCREQVTLLPADPLSAPARRRAELPPAARGVATPIPRRFRTITRT